MELIWANNVFSMISVIQEHLRRYDIRYDTLEHRKEMTIFDIGANIGQSCIEFRKHYCFADIYCFEPVNETFLQLTETANKLENKSKIFCYNLALGSEDKTETLFLKENSLLNSLANNEASEANNQSIEVQIMTLDSFCSLHQIKKIDLLKLDVEGYEISVLKGAEKLLTSNLVTFLAVEVGFLQNDLQHTSFFDLHQYLNSRGYKLWGFYEQCRYKSSEGLALGYCNALYINAILANSN